MDTRPRIRLAPLEDRQPHLIQAPIDYARRWDSPDDKGEVQPVVRVFFAQPAYARVHIHTASDLDNEVGGILLGKWCLDPVTGSQYLMIESVLRARYTRQSRVHLTFTQDSFVYFQDIIDKRHTGKQIVGWYHTHPRMGVFFSSWDHWLHENFFPQPWQVALVIEPYSFSGGFFIKAKDGTLDTRKYYGFYELTGRDQRSVMLWRNLKPGQVHPASQGGFEL